MIIQKLLEFVDAYKIHKEMMDYNHRDMSAARLAAAYLALPCELRDEIDINEDACHAYESVVIAGHVVTGEAQRFIRRALEELAVPFADSIVEFNSAPEPVSFVAPSIAEDA